jgi:hypothetical protein
MPSRAHRVGPRRWSAAALGALVAAVCLLGANAAARGGKGGGHPDTADRLIFWVGCERDVVTLTDEELDTWKERGVDGFVCMVDRLRGMGGSQDFSGDPNASLSGPNFALQRSLRDSQIVQRAADRGMKLYLGFKLANYSNTSTPLMEWFDDAGWSQVVLPEVRDFAAAARQLGFAGLALDQELYRQTGGVQTATWNWNYPGNTHTEAQVRAQVTLRGEQLMGAILDSFPGAELAVYHWYWPQTWRELATEVVHGKPNAFAENTNWNLWDGMTRTEGYAAIRLFDSIFYKTSHRGDWATAMQYNVNRTLAFASRRFSNWAYASSRLQIQPFSWIDPGPDGESDFDDARPPEYVAEQLLAMRKWGTGGEFANYAYRALRGFDYSPYVSAMQAASTPGRVDEVEPTLELTGSGARLEGVADDNLAIRVVRWRDDRGGSGAAELDWQALSGNYSTGYEWQMRWSIPSRAFSPGATEVTIVAEDIKGNESRPAAVAAGGMPTLSRKPPKRLQVRSKSARVRFDLRTPGPASRFECSLDGHAPHTCGDRPVGYRLDARRRWTRHTFVVSAADGNVGLIRYRFALRRRR